LTVDETCFALLKPFETAPVLYELLSQTSPTLQMLVTQVNSG